MTIIVFLIDTSASMNQRGYLGGRPTLLDVAKGAVETFVKVRQRSPESRGDRYMLMTFEEPPHNIKAGWKENLATFMNELKNLQCQGMTMMGAALKHAFDVLNINRMQTGIDTYGQGRCPFFLEPSVIVVITDGSKLSNTSGVQEEFNLPMHSPIPGSEMTREPFRWDQRLFSLVLRMSGTPAMDRDTGLVPSDSSPIDAMCEVTGGRSYSITSQRMLMQCIDSLVLKVQSGVVINFEKIGPDPAPITSENSRDGNEDGEEQDHHDWDKEIINPNHHSEMKIPANGNRNGGTGTHTPLGSGPNINNTAWHNCRRLIYVPKSAQKGFAIGFWPIPESFWPDLSASSLPPRSAHPNVKFMCTSQEPMVIENLPFDKYELEPSPLTQYILARKQPTVCWQVFVPNSYRNSDVGHPFGYLKASTNLTCVNLFVMPYNYPALLPLLDDLFKVHRQKPTPEWRNQFANYLRTMPLYYAGPLRRALARMCSPQSNLPQTLVPDTMENSLSYSVLNYLKRLKNQAKIEYDRLCSEVSSKQPLPGSKGSVAGSVNEGIRVVPRSVLKRELISHPLLQDKFTSMKEQLNEFGGFVVGVVRNRQHQHRVGGQSLRNPFDIPRRNLIDQVVRMRANFLQPAFKHTKMLDEDYMHSMPVSQMGNYQEYLKRMPSPLREVESTPVRQHMFGNPFKIDKRMMVDEADIDLVSSGSPHRSGSKRGGAEPLSPRPSNKRKPGPIPRDVMVRRPVAPPPTPPPTPPPATNLSLPPPLTPAVAVNGEIDELNSLGSEDSRARSPSPPPLQPYDECPTPTPHLPPYAPPSLGPPPLTPSLLEEESPTIDWHPHHISPPRSPPGLSVIKQPSELALSKSELVEIRRHNLNIRSLAYREVRRPGINYAPLFGHLEHLKGSVEIRAKVLTDVINESLRFKRKKLANLLDEFLQSMLTTGKGTNGER
ncbi:integrator complex subunit 6 [Macrosteles quadrilineatus]|uniref:integrator complex subunit 6 n=1 Tax=Macrosteles quadrilineatus TaxID=74068 RepID=UPI0023E22FB8|nr:integrator complex subunit 6 [Macrosteles quadrilineatus]